MRSALMAIAIVATQSVGAGAQSASLSPLTQQPSQGTVLPARQWNRHGRFVRRARVVRRLFRGVRLTQPQRHQLRAIRRTYAAQWRSLRATHDRRQARALRLREVRDVRNVLTPEQRQRFDANWAAIRAHRRRA